MKTKERGVRVLENNVWTDTVGLVELEDLNEYLILVIGSVTVMVKQNCIHRQEEALSVNESREVAEKLVQECCCLMKL